MGWQENLQGALAHHQGGRLSAAIALYRKVLSEQPKQPDANHLYGLALDQSVDRAAGLAHVEMAAALDRRHPVYLSNLGFLLGNLDRAREAERACRASIALDGKDAEVHNNLGLALEGQERLEEAAAAYAAAIAVAPGHMNAIMNRGDVLRRLGRVDEALGSFEAARALDAKFPPATLNLASLLLEEGHLDEAKKLAREFVAQVPGFAKVHNLLGAVLKSGQNLAGVEICLRKAMETDPKDLEIAVNLAGALAEQKKYDEAESLFKRILNANLNQAAAHEGLGKLSINLRKYAAANRHLTRAVELRPDSHSAHALLPFNDQVVSNYLFLWPSTPVTIRSGTTS